MQISAEGRKFIAAWEGCRLESYLDSGGRATIGVGHLMLPGDSRGPLTQDEADALFVADLLRFEDAIAELVTKELRQHEFDAVVSLAFNVGTDAFARSQMRGMINAENFVGAACEFTKWGKVDRRWDIGLLRRRGAEQAIFLLADYSRVP